MSISTVRTTLAEILTGTVDAVRMSYRGGGQQQVVTFTLDGVEKEFVIPGDAALVPAVAAAARELQATLNGE